MRKLLIPMILLVMIFSAYSFTPVNKGAAKIKWLTWEQAMEKSQQNKKKIMVFIHTDWCGWCKRMDETTFDQDYLVKYINQNFYAVKFDAEQKEDIKHKDKVYKFVNKGRRGYHEFAAAITMGRLSYPTTVFFDENGDVIQPIPGYQAPDVFEMILTYFGGQHYQKTPWDKYEKNYIPMTKKQLTAD